VTYRVLVAPLAKDEMARFAAYAAEYADEFAIEQFERLNQIITVELAEAPLMWRYFYVTGAPYLAYLFRVGRHTQFWIVYTVDEASSVVKILRFWNARRNPQGFDI
jgi:hypothetical protein